MIAHIGIIGLHGERSNGSISPQGDASCLQFVSREERGTLNRAGNRLVSTTARVVNSFGIERW